MNVQRAIVKMRQTIPVGSGKLTSVIDLAINKHQWIIIERYWKKMCTW